MMQRIGRLTLAVVFLGLSTSVDGRSAKSKPTPKPVKSSGVTGNKKKSPKWTGSIPEVAQKAEHWVELIDELGEQQMLFGQLAAARRMLLFFEELSIKERAYQAIVNLVDLGYVYSTRELFVTGDISPKEDGSFANSYFLYKALVSENAQMDKWAQYYFSKVDREKFPKFLFYEALKSYGKGNLDEATEKLKTILKNDEGSAGVALIRKVTRMLARIYFEQKKYTESLDIYMNFLLKLNPVTSSDWLEAAWNAYYLEQYSEALGLLYNFEGKTKEPIVNLEQYVLRALIYKSVCATDSVGRLLENFEADFGNTIRGIKTGETLKGLERLLLAFHPENQSLYHAYITRGELLQEQKNIEKIKKEHRPLANYLFETELASLDRELKLNIEASMDRAAKQMLVLFESLRFLSFDVAREKYRPEAVFKESERDPLLVENAPDNRFVLHWTQMGDFWRDERLKFKALLKDQCQE